MNFYKETSTGERKTLSPNVREKSSSANRGRVNLDESLFPVRANLANEILVRAR